MRYIKVLRLLLNKVRWRLVALCLLAMFSGIFGTHFLLSIQEDRLIDGMLLTDGMQDTLMLITAEQPLIFGLKHPYWENFYAALLKHPEVKGIGRQASCIIEVASDKQGLMYFTSQSLLERIDLRLSAGSLERWESGDSEIPVILDHRLRNIYAIGEVFQAKIRPTIEDDSFDEDVALTFRVSGFLQKDNMHINLFTGYANDPSLSDWAMRVLYGYLPEDEVLQIPLFIAPYEPILEAVDGLPYSEGMTFAIHLSTTDEQAIGALQRSLMQAGIGQAYTIGELQGSGDFYASFQNTKMLMYGIAFLGILLASIMGVQYAFAQHQAQAMLILRMLGMPMSSWYGMWSLLFNAVLVVFTYIGGQLVPYVGSFETYYFYLDWFSFAAILPTVIVLVMSLAVSAALYRLWSNDNIIALYRRERD